MFSIIARQLYFSKEDFKDTNNLLFITKTKEKPNQKFSLFKSNYILLVVLALLF